MTVIYLCKLAKDKTEIDKGGGVNEKDRRKAVIFLVPYSVTSAPESV